MTSAAEESTTGEPVGGAHAAIPEAIGLDTPLGFRLHVREVVDETHDTRSLVLDVPAQHSDRFQYAPGQFLTVRVDQGDNGSAARCYSLASAPGLDRYLTVTVKRVAGGAVSNWICDHVEPGQELEVLPPAGRFTPRSLDSDLLLLAAGSGITPIMSIARSVLEKASGTVVLIYANRDERSVIFADRLNELSDRFSGRFNVIHLLGSVEGQPTAARIQKLVAPYVRFEEALICGPAPFMEMASRALRTAGMPREYIATEKFLSLTADPFSSQRATSIADQSDCDAATLAVTIAGESHEMSWPRDAVLLDLLRRHGLDAPFSCREGACSSCACRVKVGKVKMARNDVLEQEDLEDGWVLACQAFPLTDDIVISYD